MKTHSCYLLEELNGIRKNNSGAHIYIFWDDDLLGWIMSIYTLNIEIIACPFCAERLIQF